MQPQLTILEGHWFDRKNVILDLFKPLFTVWPPPEKAGDRAYPLRNVYERIGLPRRNQECVSS